MEPSARTRLSSSLRFAAGALPAILLAAYPVVSLYQQNQPEIALSVLWPSLGLAVATAVLLFALFAAITRSAARAAVASSLVVVAFYYFGLVSRDVAGLGLADSWLVLLWLVLLASCLAAALRTRRSLGTGVWALSAFAAVLVAFPAAKVISYRSAHPSVSISDPRLWPSIPQSATISGRTGPDIYYIIPDDYARSDVLKRYFGFDNSRFTSSLRRRGFVLSNDVRSPYSKSELNMASELNFDYLSRLPRILGPSSQDVLLVRKMIDDSRASRILRSLGYRYVHLDSDNITFAGDNPHISRLAAPDNLTYLWLRDSLLRFVGTRFGFTDGATNDRFRDSVRSSFGKLAATATLPGPKLVLFHTLMPHDPYIFGSQGQPVTFPDTSDTGHSTKFGMRYYVRQLQFVNHELLGVVDAILAHSRTPPVIVIQSDEGFEALPEDWGEAAVRDMRVKGLYAAYLPGTAKARLPQPLNTVNSFRLLFNRYFGTHYRLLLSVSYPELDQPYRFEAMRVRTLGAPLGEVPLTASGGKAPTAIVTYQAGSTRVHLASNGRTWRDVTSHRLQLSVDDAAFVDRLNGWAISTDCSKAKARLYHTTDGGKAWSSKRFSIFTHDCAAGASTSLDFLTDRVGFASVATPAAPLQALYRTVDGGTTWRFVSLRHWPPGPLQFRTRSEGWLGGVHLLRSRDQGRSWHLIRLPTPLGRGNPEIGPPQFTAPTFRGRRALVAAAFPQGKKLVVWVYGTADTGRSWHVITRFSQRWSGAFPAVAMSQPSSTDAWIVAPTTKALLFRTADGGRHWSRRTLPFHVVELVALDARTAVVQTGAGGTFVTHDGGASWIRATFVTRRARAA